MEEFIQQLIGRTGVQIVLNNRYMSVKGLAGVSSLMSLAYSIYQFCKSDTDWKGFGGGLIGCAAFGTVYFKLDNREKADNRKAAKSNTPIDDNSDNSNNDLPQDSNPKPFVLKSYSQLDDVTSCNPNIWYVENFVAVGIINWLLAGAGIGKSIFMVQIAVSVATGTRVGFLPDDSLIPPKARVVFYRSEVFDNEYFGKYGDGRVISESGILWRDRKDLSTPNFKGLIDDLKQLVENTNEETLVCIDPISKYTDFDADKFADEVEKLMARAKEKGFHLTFLCSAHLDELSPWKRVTSENIKGGDRLIDTGGSVFILCPERTGKNYRFLQHLKEPKGFEGNGDVLVCEIVSGENFPHGEFNCHKSAEEARPLKESNEPSKKKNTEVATPMRSPKIEWTEDMHSKLKELVDSGNNDNQITNLMNEEFGLHLHATQINRKIMKLGLRPPK